MKGQWKKVFSGLFFSAVLAGELSVATDLVVISRGMEMSCTLFLALFGMISLAAFLLFSRKQKWLKYIALGSFAGICLTAALLFVCWKSFCDGAVYQNVDSGKAQMYGGHRVMLIVPHQDDDINVLGGAVEEYVRYGSQVYPVFITNGDRDGLAEIRFAETVAVFNHIGVPEENLYFLGYGDTWKDGGPHLYNAAPGEVITSFLGKTETYGTAAHGVFREGRAYTIDHFMEDLKAVILLVRPDVIYCSDYDLHIDHKATSLVFEKVMGGILKNEPDYRPVVYKGYAYNSAWYAEPDFYETNILSTGNVFQAPYWQRPQVYRWEDRVRLPVKADTLSRSLFSSDTFATLALYGSQEAHFQAAGIINGDKVVWERKTTSLCYNAGISASSASSEVLNDFMLVDNANLVAEDHMPYDGVWVPDADDPEKTVEIRFPEPQDVDSIVLYDHPCQENNILDAVISFADGTDIHTGPLHTGGAATAVTVEKKEVTGFSVTLTETQGAAPGLSEIEAFSEEAQAGGKLIKLMDENGDFAYDYWLPASGEGKFFLYTWGAVPEVTEENYMIVCQNDACEAVLAEGALKVTCPAGEGTVITIFSSETGISDSIYVENPGIIKRFQASLSQKLEKTLFQNYCDGVHRKSATYKLLYAARNLLGNVL